MKQVDGTRILVQLITFQGGREEGKGGIIILSLLMRGLDYLHLLLFPQLRNKFLRWWREREDIFTSTEREKKK